MQNFQALEAEPPDPRASYAGGFAPKPPLASGGSNPIPPKQPPQKQNPGYAPVSTSD